MGDPAYPARKIGALLAALICAAPFAAAAKCPAPLDIPIEYGNSRFKQTRQLKNLTAPLVSEGDMTIAPGMFSWHVAKPIDIVTIVRPDGVTQSTDGGPPRPLSGSPSGNPFIADSGLLSLLAGDMSAIDKYYWTDGAQSKPGAPWRLQLKPKNKGLAEFVTAIEIRGCERIEEIAVRQKDGDSLKIERLPERSPVQ